MRKILVTSATGKIGSEFISLLSTSKDNWRIIIDTRTPESKRVEFLRKLSKHPISTITFNENLNHAKELEGLTDAFIIAPVSENMENWHQNLVDLLGKHTKAPNIIKVSVTGAANPDEYPETGKIPAQHWLGERIIRNTGWTNVCIRPNIFMQHFMMNTGLYSPREDEFYLPFTETKVSWLDCTDIALCAFHLFSNIDTLKAYHSKAFELSGQTALSPEEIEETLSTFLKRPIQHNASLEAFKKHCKQLNISDMYKHFYKEAGEGWFSEVQVEDFVNITGHLPKNFAQFVLENQYLFR